MLPSSSLAIVVALVVIAICYVLLTKSATTTGSSGMAAAALLATAAVASAAATSLPDDDPLLAEEVAASLKAACVEFECDDVLEGPPPRTLGGNNCLFDAVLEASSLKNRSSGRSQRLRELCDAILTKEGLPLIPNGMPAGEQYIQACSLAIGRPIRVCSSGSGSVFIVAHSRVAEGEASIAITHVGEQMAGHWVAGCVATAVAPAFRRRTRARL